MWIKTICIFQYLQSPTNQQSHWTMMMLLLEVLEYSSLIWQKQIVPQLLLHWFVGLPCKMVQKVVESDQTYKSLTGCYIFLDAVSKSLC